MKFVESAEGAVLFRAFSANGFIAVTFSWAVGPGCHSSRLRRFERSFALWQRVVKLIGMFAVADLNDHAAGEPRKFTST